MSRYYNDDIKKKIQFIIYCTFCFFQAFFQAQVGVIMICFTDIVSYKRLGSQSASRCN